MGNYSIESFIQDSHSICREERQYALFLYNILCRYGSAKMRKSLKNEKKTKASFDHNGKLTGEEIEYIIPATMDAKGNVVADNTAILPASDVTIELYKDDNMILSSKNVKNSEKVSVNEGELSEITFDLSKNNCNIVVTDWGTVIQHVTIG